MHRILESANVFNDEGHLHFSRLDGSNFLTEQRHSYLWRLYEHWLACGEFVEAEEQQFLLPHHERFVPERVLNSNSARFVTSLDMTVPLRDVEPKDASIFGAASSIDERTIGWCWACANAREPLYYFVKLHDHGIIQECYRLLLPSVDDGDRVVRVDIAHRFEGPNFQVVSEEVMSWT